MGEIHYQNYFLKKYNHFYVANYILSSDKDLYYRHDYYLLIYIARGYGTHNVGNASFPVSEGDIIITHPNIRHSLYCEPGKKAGYYYCCFHEETFPDIFNKFAFDFPHLSSFFKGSVPYLHVKDNENKDIRYQFIRMIDDFVYMPAGYEYSTRSYLILILTKIFRISTQKKLSKNISYSNSIVDQSILLIKRDIRSKISLDDLADSQFVTKHYLCKLFKKHTGMTIIEFINIQRVEAIKDFLENTNRPTQFILEDFEMNPVYLNRIFKQSTGLTILEYRTIYHFKLTDKSKSGNL